MKMYFWVKMAMFQCQVTFRGGICMTTWLELKKHSGDRFLSVWVVSFFQNPLKIIGTTTGPLDIFRNLLSFEPRKKTQILFIESWLLNDGILLLYVMVYEIIPTELGRISSAINGVTLYNSGSFFVHCSVGSPIMPIALSSKSLWEEFTYHQPIVQREELGTLGRAPKIHTNIYHLYVYMDHIMVVLYRLIWGNIWGTTTRVPFEGDPKFPFE